jgi:hypothetical protein
MPRFESTTGSRTWNKVSKRQQIKQQTVIDPIPGLVAHMQPRLLTPVFLQRPLPVLHCAEQLPVA